MPEDKLLKDIDIYLDDLHLLKVFLDKVYYNPEFSTVFTKPMVSFLDQACDFIIDNLTKLANKYQEKKGIS